MKGVVQLKPEQLKEIRVTLKKRLKKINKNAKLIYDFIHNKEAWLNSDDNLFMLEHTKIKTGEYFKVRQEQLYASLFVEAMATIESKLKLFYKQLIQSNETLTNINPTQIIAKISQKTGVKMNHTDFEKLKYFIQSRNKLVHDSFKIGILELDKSKQFTYLQSFLSESRKIINEYLKTVIKKQKQISNI